MEGGSVDAGGGGLFAAQSARRTHVHGQARVHEVESQRVPPHTVHTPAQGAGGALLHGQRSGRTSGVPASSGTVGPVAGRVAVVGTRR
mgnify:CR=1 FL=1